MGSYHQSDEQSSNPVPRKREGRAVLDIQSGLAITATRRRRKQFYNLYPLLWNREWLYSALEAVLDNTGARTSGVDGMCGSDLREPSAKARFIEELRRELRQHTYRPSPVLRKCIPKANGKERPIGIPTIKDRVVQMTLKMVLEPIFEADFLPNSNGFRPERSTPECVLPMYRYGDSIRKYHWVIEGDIESCFDNINHEILMRAIGRRIADTEILRLIRQFLRAPVVEDGIRTRTMKGTPQGGVLSPLLANVCLNEFDHYWYEHWGSQTEAQRRHRRQRGKASCVLFRYADDFILSATGTREQVVSIMDSIRGFFTEELKLELSAEKTRVVSLEDGFEFLGFHMQRCRLGHYSCVRIWPTQRNQLRLRQKLQAMLGLRASADDPVMKVRALNRVLRGWANYYKTVNSLQQFKAGDYLARRLFQRWYCRRYQIGMRECLSKVYTDGRIIIRRGCVNTELFRMSSIRSMHTPMNFRLTWKYRSIRNPYITGTYSTSVIDEDNPMADVLDVQPTAAEYNNEVYLTNRILAFERDGWKCIQCGGQENLQAHHIEPVPRGSFDPSVAHRVANLQTLCATCHSRVPRTG